MIKKMSINLNNGAVSWLSFCKLPFLKKKIIVILKKIHILSKYKHCMHQLWFLSDTGVVCVQHQPVGVKKPSLLVHGTV